MKFNFFAIGAFLFLVGASQGLLVADAVASEAETRAQVNSVTGQDQVGTAQIAEIPGAVLLQSVRVDYSRPDRQQQAYAQALLATQAMCLQTGDIAMIDRMDSVKFIARDSRVVEQLVPANGAAGLHIYRHTGRGVFTTPDDLLLPTTLKRSQNFISAQNEVRAVVGRFYCAEKTRELRGLESQDQILSINDQEIEQGQSAMQSREEVILALNAVERVTTSVRVLRQGRELNLNLSLVDTTLDTVKLTQKNMAHACHTLADLSSSQIQFCESVAGQLKQQEKNILERAQAAALDKKTVPASATQVR